MKHLLAVSPHCAAYRGRASSHCLIIGFSALAANIHGHDMLHRPSNSSHIRAAWLVNKVKSEQVFRVLVTFGGKTQQKITAEATQALSFQLLMSFSTENEQEPVFRSRVSNQREA
ncbi:hypothetical protein [Ktedonobacter sp. SOSP1-85]|uniref:hypothetical protein n=1 Tax=Ktedonobacter sp. SOSP1-85 TaxID=2778367 RepID=UPI001916AC1F|nr:hypothetical protein [Ktedonobacter sp. SOSP1-85]